MARVGATFPKRPGVQRFFSAFRGGRPGARLLLLRRGLGVATGLQGRFYVCRCGQASGASDWSELGQREFGNAKRGNRKVPAGVALLVRGQ